MHDYTSRQLTGRRFGHNTLRLSKKVAALGLNFDYAEVQIFKLMGRTDAIIRSRYIQTGAVHWPTLEALQQVCDRLRLLIGEELRKTRGDGAGLTDIGPALRFNDSPNFRCRTRLYGPPNRGSRAAPIVAGGQQDDFSVEALGGMQLDKSSRADMQGGQRSSPLVPGRSSGYSPIIMRGVLRRFCVTILALAVWGGMLERSAFAFIPGNPCPMAALVQHVSGYGGSHSDHHRHHHHASKKQQPAGARSAT